MSDRTSAGIFADIFVYLAEQPQTIERDSFVTRMWNASCEYDFSPRQMGADQQLIELGLAYMAVDPEYPDEGEIIFYAGRR